MGNNTNKRFGAIAVEKGFISEDQLLQALNIQAKENITTGDHRLLGQVLLELEYITEAQIDEVLDVINQQMLFMISTGR